MILSLRYLVCRSCVQFVCRTQKKDLTEEERESQAQTLYSEFLSAHDHGEALTLARELAAPGIRVHSSTIQLCVMLNYMSHKALQRHPQ